MKKYEWSQEEYLHHKKRNAENGIQTLLVDTVNSPIEGAECILYNPYELGKYPEGTVLVFYCDTGKSTMGRLSEYQKRFPDKTCISLRGGRGYWRRTCGAR
jgi:hypothetical protein